MENERLELLRDLMADREIDLYVVPTADFHESEYVGDHFKARKYLTGFTGSAGVAVAGRKEAGLWTDGRYFIQAERELTGSGFSLFKMGVKGVPTVDEYIEAELPEGGVIGFDGRVVNAAWGRKLAEIAGKKNGSLSVTEDLVDKVWADRPEMKHERAWILEEKYSGESAASKIERVREVMAAEGANAYILTTLDDICWLLNIRGNDISNFPVVLSYIILTQKGCIFYADPTSVTPEVKEYLRQNKVTAAPYDDIYKMADMLGKKPVGKVMMDLNKVNYRIYEAVSGVNEVVNVENPTVMMKAVKNQVEVDNIRNAHVKDGVAMVKWLIWLKENVGRIPMTEITAEDYLAEMRASQEGFLDLSFGTISAYQANAAMMHYSAKLGKCAELRPEGFLLVDSGGHYMEGSTDITRTVVLGPITDKQKEYFTITLRSNLNLAAAKFLRGCTGQNLDILARGPLWDLGMDYRCGTGHGVGYLLNIHEAPNGFRWRSVAERNDRSVLQEGMITTDEPGVYIEGEFGIRHENELVCKKAEETEYGEFLDFEVITYCPFDLEGVDPKLMSQRERTLLNDYHKLVYKTLSPYLSETENAWLRNATREI